MRATATTAAAAAATATAAGGHRGNRPEPHRLVRGERGLGEGGEKALRLAGDALLQQRHAARRRRERVSRVARAAALRHAAHLPRR